MAKVKETPKNGAEGTVAFRPPTIDDFEIPLTWDEMEEEAKRVIVPDGVYDLLISPSSRAGMTKGGRPMITWVLQFVGEEYKKAQSIFYTTPLPHETPDGINSSGINFLVQLCKAAKLNLGKERVSVNDLIAKLSGRVVTASVKTTLGVDGEPRNEVDRFVTK